MQVGAIDASRIKNMMEQLKAAAQKPSLGPISNPHGLGLQKPAGVGGAEKLNFAELVKASLGKVSELQSTADTLGKKFAIGDDSVSLSDTMIASQKASITFQATIQVRNKLVSAYEDIMRMQV